MFVCLYLNVGWLAIMYTGIFLRESCRKCRIGLGDTVWLEVGIGWILLLDLCLFQLLISIIKSIISFVWDVAFDCYCCTVMSIFSVVFRMCFMS